MMIWPRHCLSLNCNPRKQTSISVSPFYKPSNLREHISAPPTFPKLLQLSLNCQTTAAWTSHTFVYVWLGVLSPLRWSSVVTPNCQGKFMCSLHLGAGRVGSVTPVANNSAIKNAACLRPPATSESHIFIRRHSSKFTHEYGLLMLARTQ